MNGDKILIIGLDGADFRYIIPFLKSGELPHLKYLIENGSSSYFLSTEVPFTAQAWSSLLTGCSPAVTGVIDGAVRKNNSYEIIPTHLKGFKGVPFWKILNHYGLKVGLVNVPMTYPPSKIEGYIISGFDTPRGKDDFCYPPSIGRTLKEKISALLDKEHYIAIHSNPHHQRIPLDEYIREIRNAVDLQKEILGELIENIPCNCLMTVFQFTDVINHRTNDRRYIKEVYRMADEFIGYLIDRMPKDTMIFCLSDHGSEPVEIRINLSLILKEAGLLAFKPKIANEAIERIIKRFFPKFMFLSNGLLKIWHCSPFWLQKIVSFVVLKFYPGLANYYSNIDWQKTKVYAFGGWGPLYLNLKRREPLGVVTAGEVLKVKQLVKKILESVKNPLNGKNAFSKVWFVEEVWQAKEKCLLPDIIFQPNEGVDVLFQFPKEEKFGFPRVEYGKHAPEGIFIAAGRNIKKNYFSSNKMRIYDFVPTLLYLTGVKLPNWLTGNIFKEIIEESYLEKHKVEYADIAVEERETKDKTFTKEEIKSIQEKLEGLGYF